MGPYYIYIYTIHIYIYIYIYIYAHTYIYIYIWLLSYVDARGKEPTLVGFLTMISLHGSLKKGRGLGFKG